MTVSSTTNKITFQGNASTTLFPFAFAVPANTFPANLSNIVVFFTDALGNVTQLVEGPANTQYQLTIDPPVSPNPTPVGGTVTYAPGGSPIGIGTQLTIIRSLPDDQPFTFANQGIVYPTAIEQAIDYQNMLIQQQIELQSRALMVPVSDPIPAPLPSVAQRAGFTLGFDSNGNPIAVSGIAGGTVVSSPLIPVVTAASLGAARTALGLGTIATESIGLGLEDNGAGAVQTFYKEVTDVTNQSVTKSFHSNVRLASGAIIYTFAASTSYFNGFGFFIYNPTSFVELTPNGTDTFLGMGTGQSLAIPAGSRFFVSTDGAGNWFTTFVPVMGMNGFLNMSIVTSVASGAMTVALKDANGNDPSASSPILGQVCFGSTQGTVAPFALTQPISITIPSGASIGTVSGLPSRLWLALFDNAGSFTLGVYNSFNAGALSIVSWDETTGAGGTGISSGSTLSQTWYTAVATGAAFRILGFIESVQSTAGVWSALPTRTMVYSLGSRKPGDVIRLRGVVGASSIAFNLQYPGHPVEFSASASVGANSASTPVVTWQRNSTVLFTQTIVLTANAMQVGVSASLIDLPGGNVTYSINSSVGFASGGQVATAKEYYI